MNTGIVTPAIVNIVVGVVVIVLSIPLLMNKIGMNRWYGIRFKKSFESAGNWYRINRYGAGRLVLWSFIIIAIGIAALLRPPHGGILRIVVSRAPLLIVIPIIESRLYAKRLVSDN
jgi:hypothetical protein